MLLVKPVALLRSSYIEFCGKDCVCDAPVSSFSIAPRRLALHDKMKVSADVRMHFVSRVKSLNVSACLVYFTFSRLLLLLSHYCFSTLLASS